MGSSGTPNSADLLKAAVAAGTAAMHTALPGVVVSYDATKQTISAQVVIQSRYKQADGTLVAYTPPVISNIPVAFPSGGSWSITWPLAAGDPVVLVFAERSLDEWKATGNSESTPAHLRRFDLSDAIAIPGAQAPASPLEATAYDASAMVIAGDLIKMGSSAASAWIALASLVDARLAAMVAAHNAHVHATGVGPTATPTVPMAAQASVASTKVRSE